MATSMASDELVFSMSAQTEGSPMIFIKRDWLSILDNQNQSYGSNQCVIDTSQLSNSNKYMNYSEANLIVPLLITVTSSANGLFNPNINQTPAFVTNVPSTGSTAPCTPANWAFGLKNWLGSIVHSFSCDMNGTTIIQSTSYSGMWNTFQMITSFSYNDFTSWANIGFYPDTAQSAAVTLAATATPSGQGSVNNFNGPAPTQVDASGKYNTTPVTNLGFFTRQQYWNFSPMAGATLNYNGGTPTNYYSQYGALLNGGIQTNGQQNACTQMYKSYIFNLVNSGAATTAAPGVYQQAITGIIKLKHLHSFWQEIPLMKGVFFKLTLNLNQTYYQVTKYTDNTLSLSNMTSPLGGVNTLCWASSQKGATGGIISTGSGSSPLPAAVYTCSIAVGGKVLCPLQTGLPNVISSPMLQSVMLSLPSYTFNPVFETSYLSQSVKTVVYNDLYQYFIPSVPASTNFNNLITNGIAGIQSVLVLPFYTPTANDGINPIQSPFGMEGGGPSSPLCLINNFNVIVSGAQMIYQTEKYTYEQFTQQLYGYNQLNGGLNDEINSGLINQIDFDMCYNYYYVNCARKLPIEQSVPMSVNIVGQNMSTRDIQLYVFICYQTQISLDVLTGARV